MQCSKIYDEIVNPEYVTIVNEFLDIFPDKISRMPPPRVFEFTIDIVLGEAYFKSTL